MCENPTRVKWHLIDQSDQKVQRFFYHDYLMNATLSVEWNFRIQPSMHAKWGYRTDREINSGVKQSRFSG